MHLLCVCSGNTCRSPMLQTVLRAALATAGRTDVEVRSAGTGAADGDVASDGALRAMARRGLSLADHASSHIASVDLAAVDRVYCMTSAHAAAVRSRGVPAAKIFVINADLRGVPDPWGGDDRAYEACATVLEHAAEHIVSDLPA
jgi:protein-tyrosine-phosphatase